MTSSQKAAMVTGGMLGSYFTILGIISLVYLVFRIIAYWKIFVKAGEPGWKSIIPIYHDYTAYKFTWKTSFFWIYLVSLVLMSILSRYANNNVFLAILTLVVCIIAMIVSIKQLYLLSKSFGYGAGFTVGLVLLYPIFILILGFGSAKYIGNQSN